MAFIGSLEDRMAIRDLYGVYADAGSRNNAAGWLDTWAENGRWKSHIFDCTGKEELRKQHAAVMAMFDDLAFMSEVGAIEVSGDKAIGRSMAREIGRMKNGKLFKLVGRYDDQLVRVNGRWLFAYREYQPVVQEMEE